MVGTSKTQSIRKWDVTMHVVSEHELNLSAKLYGLLGGLSAEISQLPTERTVRDWTEGEVLHSVCRCKDALIDALRCALRLSQLGELDELSRQRRSPRSCSTAPRIRSDSSTWRMSWYSKVARVRCRRGGKF